MHDGFRQVLFGMDQFIVFSTSQIWRRWESYANWRECIACLEAHITVLALYLGPCYVRTPFILVLIVHYISAVLQIFHPRDFKHIDLVLRLYRAWVVAAFVPLPRVSLSGNLDAVLKREWMRCRDLCGITWRKADGDARSAFPHPVPRFPTLFIAPSNYESPKVIHSVLLYIDLSLTSAIWSTSNNSPKFETHIRFQFGFRFAISVIWEETATSTAGSECGYKHFFNLEHELTYTWNTARTTNLNASSTLPIFMTHIQIQVGCYRLVISVSVAGVGEETRSLTANSNEGAHYRSFDPMPQTDHPVEHYSVLQLRGHKSRPDTVGCRAVIVHKDNHSDAVD